MYIRGLLRYNLYAIRLIHLKCTTQRFCGYSELCNNQHYTPKGVSLRHSRRKPCDPPQSLPNPRAGETPSYFLFLQFCLFWACCRDGIVQHVAFCVWFLSLSMFARLQRVASYFQDSHYCQSHHLTQHGPCARHCKFGELDQ